MGSLIVGGIEIGVAFVAYEEAHPVFWWWGVIVSCLRERSDFPVGVVEDLPEQTFEFGAE